MGGKDSKLSFIPYDDAVKRVGDTELKRIKEAFKRASTLNGYMSENLFVHEVLWDGVPAKLSQLIFHAFGGTAKGLTLKDLVCGLVCLTRGSLEEKIRFMFGMYSGEPYTYVQKESMDNQVLETEGQVSTALSHLFKENDQVDYDHFKSWILRHPDATIISKWMLLETSQLSLSSDMETPTFFQTLAGVTHLEESDINELETRYWHLKALSKSGRFDFETFKPLVSPPMPECLVQGLFSAFDENCDNHIDFKEMACGISACCRGPTMERQKFCFKVFNTNHDGKLCKDELVAMLDAVMALRIDGKSQVFKKSDIFHQMDAETVATEILSCHDSDADGCITIEEYLVWTVNNTLSDDFLCLLSQICHVILGLRPRSREEEGSVIRDWLHRESHKPLQVGQTWYLVAIQWWNAWLDYVNQQALTNGHIEHPPSDERRSPPKDSPSRSKIAKVRGAQPLPEDDNLVIVTKVTQTGDRRVLSADDPTVLCNGRLGSSPVKSVTNHSTTLSSPNKARSRHTTPTAVYKPGAIDNTPLIITNSNKLSTLTNEGGKLKRDTTLARGRDFELLPEPIWNALCAWYGGAPALPRNVIAAGSGEITPELELYPVTVRLLRHQTPTQRPPPQSTFTGMMAGIGGITFNGLSTPFSTSAPRRYLAYTAAFSKKHTFQQIYDFLCTRLRFNKEDIRLWKYKDEQNMLLLDDETLTMDDVGVEENQQIVIELRNKDLTWPEEISQLAKNKHLSKKKKVPTATLR